MRHDPVVKTTLEPRSSENPLPGGGPSPRSLVRRRASLRWGGARVLAYLVCLVLALPFLPTLAAAGIGQLSDRTAPSTAGAPSEQGGTTKKKSTTKKATTKKSTTKKATTKKSTTKKSSSKKSTAKKSTAKKSTAKKSSPKKSTAKKSSSKKAKVSSKKSSRSKAAKSKAKRSTRGARKVRSVNTGATDYAAAIVVDAESGAVLYERAADLQRSPASLTKMMTELLTIEAIERGEAALTDTVIVPYDVAYVGGTRARLAPGERITLNDLLNAMAIASANDAALTIAIYLAGSESGFVGRMNRRAEELGMSRTRYQNPHGLDRDLPTLTTARDQAILAQTLLRHEATLQISSKVSETIRGKQVVRNTNRLLTQYPGCDGLKTGFTSRAGYCLCTTAEREDMRLVSVVLGSPTSMRRFNESTRLLDDAFTRYERVKVLGKGEDLGHLLRVTGPNPVEVPLVSESEVGVVVRSGQGAQIRYRVDAPLSAEAPVPAGAPIGTIEVLVGDSVAVRAAAVASRSTFLQRGLTVTESTR